MTIDEMYPSRQIESPEEVVIIFHSLNRHHRCMATLWYRIKMYWQLFDYAKRMSYERHTSSVTVWRETAEQDILLAEYRNNKTIMELPLRNVIKEVTK